MSRNKADDYVYKDFGRRLESRIDGSKQKFAENVGVKYETVRVWCLGKFLPNTAQLLRISTELKESIDWLLTGKREINNYPYDQRYSEIHDFVEHILLHGNSEAVNAFLFLMKGISPMTIGETGPTAQSIQNIEKLLKKLITKQEKMEKSQSKSSKRQPDHRQKGVAR